MKQPRKIEAMYQRYGHRDGMQCKYCDHFERYKYKGYDYSKCEIYGITNSEATDWRASNNACGMFNEPWDAKENMPVIETIKHIRNVRSSAPGQLDGQMGFEDYLKVNKP